jgi:hypothetical protein
MLGVSDVVSALLGGGVALLGGNGLDSIGVAAVALGATAIVAAPVVWMVPRTVTDVAAASPQ